MIWMPEMLSAKRKCLHGAGEEEEKEEGEEEGKKERKEEVKEEGSKKSQYHTTNLFCMSWLGVIVGLTQRRQYVVMG